MVPSTGNTRMYRLLILVCTSFPFSRSIGISTCRTKGWIPHKCGVPRGKGIWRRGATLWEEGLIEGRSTLSASAGTTARYSVCGV